MEASLRSSALSRLDLIDVFATATLVRRRRSTKLIADDEFSLPSLALRLPERKRHALLMSAPSPFASTKIILRCWCSCILAFSPESIPNTKADEKSCTGKPKRACALNVAALTTDLDAGACASADVSAFALMDGAAKSSLEAPVRASSTASSSLGEGAGDNMLRSLSTASRLLLLIQDSTLISRAPTLSTSRGVSCRRTGLWIVGDIPSTTSRVITYEGVDRGAEINVAAVRVCETFDVANGEASSKDVGELLFLRRPSIRLQCRAPASSASKRHISRYKSSFDAARLDVGVLDGSRVSFAVGIFTAPGDREKLDNKGEICVVVDDRSNEWCKIGWEGSMISTMSWSCDAGRVRPARDMIEYKKKECIDVNAPGDEE
jgi:hypothetical protein